MKYQERVAEKARARRKLMLFNLKNGFSVTEIAAKHGISKQRVSQLLKRARSET